MKRRWFAVIGTCLLLGQIAVLAAFGFPPVRGWTTVGSILPSLAGVLFIAGGFSAHSWNVEWYQFVGAANVLMGIWFGLEFSFLPYSDSAVGPVLAIAGVVGGLSMVFIGVCWIRYPEGFGIVRYESGPLLIGRHRS